LKDYLFTFCFIKYYFLFIYFLLSYIFYYLYIFLKESLFVRTKLDVDIQPDLHKEITLPSTQNLKTLGL